LQSLIYWGVFTSATPFCHNLSMTIDALENGQLCDYCGTPIFFNVESMRDCPKCGAEWVNAEDDPADRLDGPAVDLIELDNDHDMIENSEFGDSDDFGNE